MKPGKILFYCAQTNDWLYPPMMAVLRERYGTRFYLVVADDRVDSFRAHCAEGDVIVPVTEFGPAPVGTMPPDPAAVFDTARKYEEKYQLTYLRDVIQQDRMVASRFLNNAPNSIFSDYQVPSLVELCDFVNRAFDYHETLIREQGIDLIVNRPGGLSDSVMAEVALARGVPMTFFHGSYFGGGAQWAAGPYMGDLVTRKAWEETPPQEPIETESLLPSATWTRPPDPQLLPFAISMIKTFVIYGEFLVKDLKARRRHKRVPLLTNLKSDIRQFRVKRFLHATGEADLDRIASLPFVYMAMPHEPEYTVQSLCREFADPTAWIRQLAISLPAGYRLVIKEHQRIGNRTRDYYEAFARFPNIVMAHPGLRGVDLIARCAATATMGGSTPAEASLFGKPSVVFGHRNPYTFLPTVTVVESPARLAEALREVLRPRSKKETDDLRRAGARFRTAMETLSFDASGTRLFRGGSGTEVDDETVRQAVDTLLLSARAQKAAAADRAMAMAG